MFNKFVRWCCGLSWLLVVASGGSDRTFSLLSNHASLSTPPSRGNNDDSVGILAPIHSDMKVEGFQGIDMVLNEATGNLLVLVVCYQLDKSKSLVVVQYSTEGKEMLRQVIGEFDDAFTPTKIVIGANNYNDDVVYFAGNIEPSHFLFNRAIPSYGKTDIVWGKWSMSTKSITDLTVSGGVEDDCLDAIAVSNRGEVYITGTTSGGLESQPRVNHRPQGVDLLLMKFAVSGEKIFSTATPIPTVSESTSSIRRSILLLNSGSVQVVSTTLPRSTYLRHRSEVNIAVFSSLSGKQEGRSIVNGGEDDFLHFHRFPTSTSNDKIIVSTFGNTSYVYVLKTDWHCDLLANTCQKSVLIQKLQRHQILHNDLLSAILMAYSSVEHVVDYCIISLLILVLFSLLAVH